MISQIEEVIRKRITRNRKDVKSSNLMIPMKISMKMTMKRSDLANVTKRKRTTKTSLLKPNTDRRSSS